MLIVVWLTRLLASEAPTEAVLVTQHVEKWRNATQTACTIGMLGLSENMAPSWLQAGVGCTCSISVATYHVIIIILLIKTFSSQG